jgi:hypothetical protein
MPHITLRPALPGDAAAIGAVFDAAVRAGWTYLGGLVDEPMFRSEDWEQLVADHVPPNVLLVAVDETEGVVGYTAVHPEDGEMFLLVVHPPMPVAGSAALSLELLTTRSAPLVAGRYSSSSMSRTSVRSRSMPLPATGRTALTACRSSTGHPYASFAS